MKTPRYTDLHRYKCAYRKDTDVGRTFARERRRLEEEAAKQQVAESETVAKVRTIKKEAQA
ncbi:MAG: hypothetical protein ACTS6J_12170 [Burkholderiales bacterium]